MITRCYIIAFCLINSALIFNLTAGPKKAPRSLTPSEKIEEVKNQIETEKKEIERLKKEKKAFLKKYFSGNNIDAKEIAKELSKIEKELEKKENSHKKLLAEKAKLDDVHRNVKNANSSSLSDLTKQQNTNQNLKKEIETLEDEAVDFRNQARNKLWELGREQGKHQRAQETLNYFKNMTISQKDTYANEVLDEHNKKLQDDLIEAKVKAATYKKMLDDKNEENKRIQKTINGCNHSIRNYENTLNNNMTDGKSDPISTITHPKQTKEAHALYDALKNSSYENMILLFAQSRTQDLSAALIIARGEENIELIDALVDEIDNRTMGFAKKYPYLNTLLWAVIVGGTTYVGLQVSPLSNK